MASYTLKNIAQDLLQGKLQISTAELAQERIKVCESCPEFKRLARQCKLCGCFMDMKTKLLEAHCPADKW
jgi:hypothetical protein